MKSRLLILVLAVAVAVGGYSLWTLTRPVPELPEPVIAPDPEPEATPMDDAPAPDTLVPEGEGAPPELPEGTGDETTEPLIPEGSAPATEGLDPAPDSDIVDEPLRDEALPPGEQGLLDDEAPEQVPAELRDMAADSFDPAALRALIDDSDLNAARKLQLRALVDTAAEQPELVENALQALRDALAD